MADRKVSQNLYFLQWLYVYGNNYDQQEMQGYDGYQRRLEILERQGRGAKEMSCHLRSFTAEYRYAHDQQEIEDDGEAHDTEEDPLGDNEDELMHDL